VTSSAGDAALSVSPVSATDPAEPSNSPGGLTTASLAGRMTNGSLTLPEPLVVEFSKSSWSAPVSNDPGDDHVQQRVNANDALPTGSYSKTLTFTLSTTTP
jgi:hypothetical protein